MTTEARTDRRRPGLVVIVAFLVSLAGRFTLDRLGISVPLVNDVRVPLFAALLMSFALELKGSGHRGGTGVRSLFAILALLSYQIISATWTPSGAATGAAVGDLTADAILVFVYVTLAEWDRDRVVRVTLTCFYAAAWVYFLVAAVSSRGHTATGRWAALGGGPNVFVRIMVLGALSSMYFYFRAGRKPIWLLGVPAFLTGALASGSRGGIVALLSTLACAIWVALPRLRPSASVKPLLTIAVLGGATWLVAGDEVGGLIQRRFVQGTLEQGYTSDRDVLFKLAIGLFLRHPLLGTGVSGFYVETNQSVVRYVHNLPLAVAAEGGAVGLLLLINAFVQLRHEFVKIPRPDRSLEARAAGYCGIFVGGASLFSGDYYDARLMWILLVLAAVRPAPIERDTLQE